MLGRVRRTTQADVGLALALSGISYLTWVLATGIIRHVALAMARAQHAFEKLSPAVSGLANWFARTGLGMTVVLDVVGVLWLVLSLVLLVGASRQRWSNSWTWLSAALQSMVACLGAAWAALAAAERMSALAPAAAGPAQVSPATIGWMTLPIAAAVALLIWVTVLVTLLLERARLARGPSLRDGLRTHVQG